MYFLHRAGPLLYASCIRMEGKNLYFKNAARGSNFKNVPYTVATRHQRLLCSYLQCKNFFNTEIECGPGKHIDFYGINACIMSILQPTNPNSYAWRSPQLSKKLRNQIWIMNLLLLS